MLGLPIEGSLDERLWLHPARVSASVAPDALAAALRDEPRAPTAERRQAAVRIMLLWHDHDGDDAHGGRAHGALLAWYRAIGAALRAVPDAELAAPIALDLPTSGRAAQCVSLFAHHRALPRSLVRAARKTLPRCDTAARAALVEGLFRGGPAHAAELDGPLVNALQHHTDATSDEASQRLTLALAAWFERSRAPAAGPGLLRLLIRVRPPSWVRGQLAAALGAVGHTPAFEAVAALTAQDDDFSTLLRATEALGALGDARAEERLRALASYESARCSSSSTSLVREAAIEVLAALR